MGRSRKRSRLPLKILVASSFPATHAKTTAPDAVFITRAVRQGAIFMKEFVERGLDKSGVG